METKTTEQCPFGFQAEAGRAEKLVSARHRWFDRVRARCRLEHGLLLAATLIIVSIRIAFSSRLLSTLGLRRRS